MSHDGRHQLHNIPNITHVFLTEPTHSHQFIVPIFHSSLINASERSHVIVSVLRFFKRRQAPFAPPVSTSYELNSFTAVQNREVGDDSGTPSPLRDKDKKWLRLLDDMKFSHSIQFNAVPDWQKHYIDYSNLKKRIYILEQKLHGTAPTNQQEDEESTALIGDTFDPDAVFSRALDKELKKISDFYAVKEKEMLDDVDELQAAQKDYDELRDEELGASANFGDASSGASGRRKSIMPNPFGRTRSISGAGAGTGIDSISPGKRRKSTGGDERGSDSEDEEDELMAARRQVGRRKSSWGDDGSPTKRRGSISYAEFTDEDVTHLLDQRITLKKRTISLYVSLVELKSYIQLNKTGFTKALKKYDKILNRDLRRSYIEKYVDTAYVFRKATINDISTSISTAEEIYADLVTNREIEAARRELRLHLREHVVWERNTVWREMIGIERKAQAANMGLRRTLLGPDDHRKNVRLQGDEAEILETKEYVTPVGRFRCPAWLVNSHLFVLIFAITAFITLILVPIFETPEEQNCFAILIFASILWATEVVPLFVTSIIIPMLVVLLRVVREDAKPHHRLDAKDAAKYIFSSMWAPVIMLLLGGFTIAAALSKYHIAKLLATLVLSKAGTRPRTVLLTNMFVAMFASMWISNVAAPVLCFSLIQPVLRNLPSDSEMSKALILGIALASNIGGMASPIASPQNIIALQNMKPEPSWGEWFAVSIPVSVLSILAIWVLLLVTFQPGRGTKIIPIRPMKDPFSGVQWFISIVTVGTIILWCVTHQLESFFGDMGVVAIIPIVMFFGTGILTKEDFNNFLWTIIILAAGGLSLGKAVNSSGLLETIAHRIEDGVQGLSLYGILCVFCGLILVVASFISHTVAALIVLPIVQQVGLQMDDPHPRILVMGSAMMCSAAMALPTSGFPNMTAIMMEDSQTGRRYLHVKHFITRGIPASIITFGIVISVGYGLMRVVGF